MDGSTPISSGGENIVSTGATPGYDPSEDPARKAKSNDPGWKYGYWPDLTNKNVVKCTLCGKEMSCGIKRLKQHLVGGYGDVIKFGGQIQSEDTLEGQSQTPTAARVAPSSGTIAKKRKVTQPQVRGPMDAHVRRTPEQVVNERHNSSSTQTTIENRFRTPEQKARVDYHIAKWLYQQGIPFNAIKARTFEVMCESIAQYGSGYIPPSYHQVRVPLLRNVVNETAEMKKKYEEYWKQYGCTLMSDGWTDKRGRHLINFLVNCPEGTYFMGSVDASGMVQSAQMLFELLDSKIDEIGEDYVIQVVTDNASNYKLAGKMLMEKRRKLYWTPCAAHCLDLMLEDIGGLKDFKNVIGKAKKITTFIYRHTRLLDAMRKRTGQKDLVRAAATRFATACLTCQSLVRHKDALKHLFISDEWKGSNLSKTEAGKKVEETRPAMPEVYVAMEEAKKKIREHLAHKERLWKKIISIIDRRWECQMERPLYGAALFLNPGKFFMFKENENGELIANLHISLVDVMTRLVVDPAIQDKITLQIDDYRYSKG
ncbi:uncharacterized protein LOC122648118, partial [Telopea speciosissima]|uniref:uncharacterized protein LOC122648118 n=1 Tax=Telopea speciosissima TaxID=54955 RepID=UPI001CC726BC